MNPLDDARNREYPMRCQHCWNFPPYCRCQSYRVREQTLRPERVAAAPWN